MHHGPSMSLSSYFLLFHLSLIYSHIFNPNHHYSNTFLSTSVYTTFLVLSFSCPKGNATFTCLGFIHHDRATYNCPCA
ncbi:hypothetical protein PAXRUDRAFT_776621, partial [Paxillus rubicundulus Ve08.2h10]